jgi:hypothetical protein
LRGLISLFALLSVSYLTSSGIIQALDSKSFLGDFESFARFLGMLVLLIPINFILRLFLYTPAELFWEQKLIADKYSWSDVHFNICQFPKDSIFGWGLALSNEKPYELQCVSARLIYLIQISDFTNRKERVAINSEASFLPWEKSKDQCEWTETNLPKKLVKNLVLLSEDGYKMSWSLFTDSFDKNFESFDAQLSTTDKKAEKTNSQIKVLDLNEYLFEIEFNAKIEGHSLEPYIFRGRLSKGSKNRKAIIEKQ